MRGLSTFESTRLGLALHRQAPVLRFPWTCSSMMSACLEIIRSWSPISPTAAEVRLAARTRLVEPILDKDLLNIPTTGVGNSLFQIDINQASGTLMVNLGSGTGDYVSVNVVPEPTSLTIAGIGIGAIVGYGWRRRKPAVT